MFIFYTIFYLNMCTVRLQSQSISQEDRKFFTGGVSSIPLVTQPLAEGKWPLFFKVKFFNLLRSSNLVDQNIC